MAGNPGDLLTPEAIGLASVGLAVFLGILIARRIWRGKKPSAEALEAQRRQWLSKYGKLGGGEIIEVQDDLVSYLYNVRGISYTASQDVSTLQDRLPAERWQIIGGAGVRFDGNNPANSIVLSETWTGLRQPDVR